MAEDDGTPGLRVPVRVGDDVLIIPCGSGTQTIRWLALVAAQRYRLAHIPGGRMRLRESTLTLAGAFLPLNVTSIATGAMLGPSMTIRDAVASIVGSGSVGREPLILVRHPHVGLPLRRCPSHVVARVCARVCHAARS
jgi:hypothetical protein